jgi:hypothetical protein
VAVDLILGGSLVIGGVKIVGVVTSDALGNFSFRLPAFPTIKNGSYTMEAQAIGTSGSSSQVSVPLAFKVGPSPLVNPPTPPTPPKPPKHPKPPKPKSPKLVKAETSTRKVVQIQPGAVQADRAVTSSDSNGRLIDQAVHTLVEERLLKKKGH